MTRIELPSGRLIDPTAAYSDAEVARIAANFGHISPSIVPIAISECPPELTEEYGPVKLIDLLFAQCGAAGRA